MTVVPLGATLAPVDLPPPPPAADPREPPASLPRRSGARTPQRARSPLSSRDASPVRGAERNRSPSSDHTSPLLQPFPRAAASPPPAVPIQQHSHHLSRPSSPSSIHSSGSAIFERDIEQIPIASLSLNPTPHQPHQLNHKSSRLSHLSHGSTLDHTVPAVLDDAVEALTLGGGTSRGLEGLEIEAPAPGAVGMARQSSSSLPGTAGRKLSTGPAGIFSAQSRSPSPISVASRTSSLASPAQSPPILAQLSSQSMQNMQAAGAPVSEGLGQGQQPGSPTGVGAGARTNTGSVPRPAMPQRISTGPQVPGGWAFGSGKQEEAAAQAQPEEAPIPSVPAPANSPPNAVPNHLSPQKGKPAHHRLSFISYNDLLLSVPTQVTSLGEITSGNLSPDHLPGTVSPSMSTRSPVIPPSIGGGLPPAALATGGVSSSPLMGASGTPVSASKSDVRGNGLGLGEGEWEREGLGKGLEQRLEDFKQGE
ncbi:hypothetical protein IAT38_007612 [Cryptococcus sp. DSM 104549]